MIFSQNLILSDDQAITATAISENVFLIPVPQTVHGAAAPLYGDIGKGHKIPLLVQVVTAFATLTSLTITLEVSANANLSASDILWSSGAIVLADLVVGYQTPVDFLPNGALGGQYLGLRYTVGGSNATAGAIRAGFTMGNQTNQHGA